MAEILILDDDKQFCGMLLQHVQRAGHGVSLAHSLEEGLARTRSTSYDIVFLDVRLPEGSGLDILPELRIGIFPPEVIIVTGFGDAESAELAVQCGAWDYVRKESSVKVMMLSLSRALQYRESRHGAIQWRAFSTPDLVGHSPLFRSALNVAAQAAGSDVSALIIGETGTGKELFAKAIHENSPRSGRPFVVVDCSALPETLIGSVLFGHEKGAFTGAESRREGLIAQAHGGTLFLDEIGDMPMEIQRAFLRVLQERRFRPIGGAKETESDFRVVAATHRDLPQMAERGTFRRDLFFRLRGLTVPLPPLRKRMDDVPLLTTHFVSRQCRLLGRDITGVSEGFLGALAAYHWPGNVRELAQAVASAVTTAGDDPLLFANHLPIPIRAHLAQAGMAPLPSSATVSPSPRQSVTGIDLSGDLAPLREMRERFDKVYLEALVSHSDGAIEAACRLSGLSRPHVYSLLKKHGLKIR